MVKRVLGSRIWRWHIKLPVFLRLMLWTPDQYLSGYLPNRDEPCKHLKCYQDKNTSKSHIAFKLPGQSSGKSAVRDVCVG